MEIQKMDNDLSSLKIAWMKVSAEIQRQQIPSHDIPEPDVDLVPLEINVDVIPVLKEPFKPSVGVITLKWLETGAERKDGEFYYQDAIKETCVINFNASWVPPCIDPVDRSTIKVYGPPTAAMAGMGIKDG